MIINNSLKGIFFYESGIFPPNKSISPSASTEVENPFCSYTDNIQIIIINPN
jgi:hypothetical protein